MGQSPFEDIAGLDRLVHEPARLAILTALAAAKQVDFLFLQRLTALTRGNLSAHLARLEESHLVQIEKGFTGKKPFTRIALTEQGRSAITAHLKQLQTLLDSAARWQPDDSAPASEGGT
ncbi:MAG: transcriptional regulator [Anaerolineae bacterium]|nr:transcriptional regulator [Anaerolineae bacterium]